jgi:hypothetical protein
VVVLETDLALETVGETAEPVAGDGDDLPLGDLGGGALGVAEVGQEDADAGAADRRPVGASETGQVTDVGQVGDEEAVEPALQPATPSSRASTPSASR